MWISNILSWEGGDLRLGVLVFFVKLPANYIWAVWILRLRNWSYWNHLGQRRHKEMECTLHTSNQHHARIEMISLILIYSTSIYSFYPPLSFKHPRPPRSYHASPPQKRNPKPKIPNTPFQMQTHKRQRFIPRDKENQKIPVR